MRKISYPEWSTGKARLGERDGWGIELLRFDTTGSDEEGRKSAVSPNVLMISLVIIQ